ncbi:MAG: Hepatocyte growth factor-regulated tyrosine kinase substrate [Oscillospiraceae bacterium]|jgi:hypothetical protein
MPDNHNGDSYNFHSLQEEAIRRAREMQARARLSPFEAPEQERTAEPQPSRPQDEQAADSRPSPPAPSAPPPPAKKPGEERANDPTAGLLDTLLKDNERTLIWILLLILLEEKADTALILALMYLAS